MSKLYMADVGLAAALLGIRSAEQAQAHPLRGALFETLVVNEFLKARWNGGDRSLLYYWRDHVGTEVDLVLERGNELAAVEIKSGITVASDAFNSLRSWNKYATQRGRFDAVHLGLVYGGDSAFVREGVNVLPWAQL
jgi:predicted AAA+ superfamily ATPase